MEEEEHGVVTFLARGRNEERLRRRGGRVRRRGVFVEELHRMISVLEDPGSGVHVGHGEQKLKQSRAEQSSGVVSRKASVLLSSLIFR